MRPHKEFGLNPTMAVCIICEKDTGEIALMGAGFKGEAPMRSIVGVEPCKACREKYLKSGVMIVEAELSWDKKPKPTGLISVVKASAFKRIFPKEAIPAKRIVMLEASVYQKLFSNLKQKNA